MRLTRFHGEAGSTPAGPAHATVTADWRDVLVAAGLADPDWRQRRSIELGEPPAQAVGRP
jgi:hypothetical protein